LPALNWPRSSSNNNTFAFLHLHTFFRHMIKQQTTYL
jgi:hypothetical protein